MKPVIGLLCPPSLDEKIFKTNQKIATSRIQKVNLTGVDSVILRRCRPASKPALQPGWQEASRSFYCLKNKTGEKEWGHVCQRLPINMVGNISLRRLQRITGHKTNSMYRRYRIVDEDELRQAQEQQQAFLKNRTIARKVVQLRTGT